MANTPNTSNKPATPTTAPTTPKVEKKVETKVIVTYTGRADHTDSKGHKWAPKTNRNKKVKNERKYTAESVEKFLADRPDIKFLVESGEMRIFDLSTEEDDDEE